MKRYIWINLMLILCAFSCVNRSVEKSKTLHETTEKIQGSEKSSSNEQKETTESKISSSDIQEKSEKSEQKESAGSLTRMSRVVWTLLIHGE